MTAQLEILFASIALTIVAAIIGLMFMTLVLVLASLTRPGKRGSK